MDTELSKFDHHVALKFQLYNSLFLTLPFHDLKEMGDLLNRFAEFCSANIIKKHNPQYLIKQFFKKNTDISDPKIIIQVLFGMLQFIERQIVLFDALEDAAFALTHDLAGPGSLKALIEKVKHAKVENQFEKIIKNYKVRIVFTSHPTQFYPGTILTIITQLTEALKHDRLKTIRDLLLQMGKTSFKYQRKPTPYEEALSLLWYLEKIFYRVAPNIQNQIKNSLVDFGYLKDDFIPNVELGFWTGGDRDGNPNVTGQITLDVAKLLKASILRLYLEDLIRLSRKLTFLGIFPKIKKIRKKIENTYLNTETDKSKSNATSIYLNVDRLLEDLAVIKQELIEDHDSLFLENLEAFIIKVKCFGFHFSSLDMREDSSIHQQIFKFIIRDLIDHVKPLESLKNINYQKLSEKQKIKILERVLATNFQYAPAYESFNKLTLRTIESIQVIPVIQNQNGEKGLCRYIISNTHSSLDVLELIVMIKSINAYHKEVPIDIVPLFESIIDLDKAGNIMETLYQCPWYRQHLRQRANCQTIMLGFSDGTKDGGYLAANWAIYKAKLNLTEISDRYQIEVTFFDGRGGPPARGGGNTNQFYRSLGHKISHSHLQLTIQGQTISTNFGTYTSAKYNLEQLFTAGIEDLIFSNLENNIQENQFQLMEKLALISQKSYYELKQNELFVPYLETMTPLKYYGDLNISSRPTMRKQTQNFEFKDLRAIPFVGSWSLLKQNIPGFYGFGTALSTLIKQGKIDQLKQLYQECLFFRTLVENAMMSLSKTFFPLTSYMQQDPKFGRFWLKLEREAKLTIRSLLQISGQKVLLEGDSLNRESIKLREQIILPLLIIQQYALIELRVLEKDNYKLAQIYKKMVLKALAANTNASRNSA